MKPRIGTTIALALTLQVVRAADESSHDLTRAIDGGLKIVQKAALNYSENRSCFSCHHQTLPMLAMVEARAFGVEIDTVLLDEQATYTHDFYKDRTENVAAGKGVGGQSLTVAYSLWALEIAGRNSDAVTDALKSYLVTNQKEDGRWQVPAGHRPPLGESNAMATFLAAYYMGEFSSSEENPEVAEAIEQSMDWIAQSDPKSQEDLNAKLWAASETGAEATEELRHAIFAVQKRDGGWAQVPTMQSDAYATGQTLYILDETGTPNDHPAVVRGVTFLLDTQKEDGSWFVETRAEPVQKFFDNGDPHGKHQFICIPATSWAVAALGRCGQNKP
ncbi:hypothetical protein BH23VER1_BH23VER1_13100 [soil metagenome]